VENSKKQNFSKWAFGDEVTDYGKSFYKSKVNFTKMLGRKEHQGVGDGGRLKTLSDVRQTQNLQILLLKIIFLIFTSFILLRRKPYRICL
jgi:hypothetical protein